MTYYKNVATKIIRDFKHDGWKSRPFERTIDLVLSSPAAATHIIKVALKELPKGSTFIDLAFSFVPEDDFSELVKTSLAILSNDPFQPVAVSVISYTSLQSLSSLHPHLTPIFELALNHDAYYENWPWRQSDKRHLDFLQHILTGREDVDAQIRFKAWDCLLETRDPELVEYAATLAKEISFVERLDPFLLWVGFDGRGNMLRRLCVDRAYHIIFRRGYFDRQRYPDWRRVTLENHPTWSLASPESIPVRFGGNSEGECVQCGHTLSHVLTLSPVPEGLVVSDMTQLELATCLACLGLGLEPLFYEHDESGKAHHYGQFRAKEPGFAATILKPTTVQLVPTPQRWYWQDDGYANGRENLHRVGGEPSWIQNATYLDCPRCGRVMAYLMQIDSYLPIVDGGEWIWGDSGICYVFWCDNCKLSGFHWQCY